jgi:hypothetical protein
MCWFTYNKEEAFQKVAEENIKVYKILKRFILTNNKVKYKSYVMDTEYKLNRLYSLDKSLHVNVIERLFCTRYNINEGFHSYIKKPYIEYIRSFGDDIVVAECIIPKGSHYCKNDTQYVSDKIKIVKVLNNF